MERWPYRHHQLDTFRHRRQRRRRRPGVKRIRVYSLDVVQVQLRDQRHLEPNFLAALRQPLHVLPCRGHLFVRHVAQPPTKYRQPISVSHACSRTFAAPSLLALSEAERVSLSCPLLLPTDRRVSELPCLRASAIRKSANRP